MWKNRFQGPRQDEATWGGESLQETTTTTTTPQATTPLPSKEDRLALYRLLERIVEQRCRSFATLTDPRSLGVKAFFIGKNVPAITSFGIRKRQIDFLRLHALPSMGAALLLGIEDIQQQEADKIAKTPSQENTVASDDTSSHTQSSSGQEETETLDYLPQLSDPFDTITLLISNMVLVSKGNYDSRVRNILKTACVPLLEALIDEDVMEDQNKARALYFLTKEHTQKETPATPARRKKSVSDVSGEADMDEDNVSSDTAAPTMDWERTTRIPKLSRCRVATQQFEAIERAIATDILKELVERDQAAMKHAKKANTWKDHVVRGLQITTMGVVVGTMFAVTGGLAAPGLVAAITALGVHSTAVFAALTTTTALASMFGAVGGGLGAYKMSKRVQGLSEWRIRKETTSDTGEEDAIQLRGLHSHVCVSGWLIEKCDFQRPFGVKCQDPSMPPLRALQRFFCVHDPEKVKDAQTILKENKEEEVWSKLKEEHGKTPDDLLPLEGEAAPVLSDSCFSGINDILLHHVLPEGAVSKMKELWEVNTMLTQMLAKNEELQGTASFIPESDFEEDEVEEMQALKAEALRIAETERNGASEGTIPSPKSIDEEEVPSENAAPIATTESSEKVSTENQTEQCANREGLDNAPKEDCEDALGNDINMADNTPVSTGETLPVDEATGEPIADASPPGEEVFGTEVAGAEEMNDHLEIIWDWQATYSGELYTLTWETDFLLKLCRVATLLFLEISDTVGKQILLNALVGSVVAIPSALWTASIVIDDPYQLISLRSKKAGVELAHCLLASDEHRPISLVGFSFGARLIFDCLLELARHQLLWQEQQAQKENADDPPVSKGRMRFLQRRRSREDDMIQYVREPASIVEDVVLIGMPRIIDQAEWIKCREVVGGRLVNCYNRKDWIVSYMINIRCFNAVSKTCGTHTVNMDGVENYEVSEFASTHDRYLAAVPQILQEVGYSQPQPRSSTGGTEEKK